WLPLHVSFIRGLVGTAPPARGIDARNKGRMSRSMRLTRTQEPKISALSPTPYPKVTGQFETSENPWLSSKLTRYALIDHFFRGSTSPVGTYQRPVSPMNVVVAGRVCMSSDDVVVVRDVVVWVVWVAWVFAVPVDVWAAAVDATASVNATAIINRFLNIRTAS